ncbi:DUF4157 domain-containing protein [Pseudoalteromonas byunsanensis]|uniref:eCIS core domain-containing protein n=1 Tax=Pseudoalteromonas byunsanensis TaxID=327939 RepID=UPI0009FBF315|nr:DUF4157 domain-containing protein [Pseudoalteromonas byunsanensis]
MYSHQQQAKSRQVHTAQQRSKSSKAVLEDNRVHPSTATQLQAHSAQTSHNDAEVTNHNTGLPHQLKSGIEQLSGYAMDDVKVHFNSPKPAQLNAHAYAQGSDIHVASGQERHLPHEAWHVVQQKQGRVSATIQAKVNINDDIGLEREADVMGAKAASVGHSLTQHMPIQAKASANHWRADVAQLALLTVNPQNGPGKLEAEKFNGPDLYMWNPTQRAGEEPSDLVGPTNLFSGWGGAELNAANFHRAHGYGKQFGGAGGPDNVAWWSDVNEDEWTPEEDKIRGDNNAGHAANWQPGEGEKGDYLVTRTLLPNQAIRDKFKDRLVAACQWGLSADRNPFKLLLPTLASDEQRAEAETARQAALAQVDNAIKRLLDNINIDAAASLIIKDMNISYTITNAGVNPGAARKNINKKVDSSLTLGDFGLVNDNQKIWNALAAYSGVFARAKQDLTNLLGKSLAAPQLTPVILDGLKQEAINELKKGKDPSYAPPDKDIAPLRGQKIANWRKAHPAIKLGPVKDGWAKV